MNIFDFLTQDEINDLPDDSQSAFTEFVRLAQFRLHETTSQLNGNNEDDWHKIEESRHGFMNVVIAAAKRFEIEPFASLDVSKVDKFNNAIYSQFKADLDHYIAQLVLYSTMRSRRNSVPIPEKSKDRIRSHLHALKECVEKANITDAKRAKLLARLNDFEKELEKTRLSLLAVTVLACEILALPGGVWSSAEVANKLITNVLEVVGEAKAADDESKILPPVDKLILLPPRKFDLKPQTPEVSQWKKTGTGSDFDDDIPF